MLLLLMLLKMLLTLLIFIAEIKVAIVPCQAGHQDNVVRDDLAVRVTETHQQIAYIGIFQLDQLLLPVSPEMDQVNNHGDGDNGDDDDSQRAQEQDLDGVWRQASQITCQEISKVKGVDGTLVR